jgi:hypothetical protein
MHPHAHEILLPILETPKLAQLPFYLLEYPRSSGIHHSIDIWCPSSTISPLAQ